MIDVAVVGGGPVGLAAALEARNAGLHVVVVEPRTGPIDKACGEGLMPGAVLALERLGVSPDGHALAGIRYCRDGREVNHRFRRGPGRGVRRTVLHAAMAAHVADHGIPQIRSKVASLRNQPGSVILGLTDGSDLEARWVLGCDGLHSTVRDLAGLAAPRRRSPRRYGLRQHFGIAPWHDLVEVHWSEDVELYVTPVGVAAVGVAVLGPQRTDFAAAILSAPALAERLAGAEPISEVRGAGPLRQHTRRRTAGRVFLVGDASGYVDAITGEGIRVGLAQASAAIRCIVAEDPQRYEREWRACTRDFRMLTAGLVRLGGSPLRPAIVPLAAALPGVYGGIVERLAR